MGAASVALNNEVSVSLELVGCAKGVDESSTSTIISTVTLLGNANIKLVIVSIAERLADIFIEPK